MRKRSWHLLNERWRYALLAMLPLLTSANATPQSPVDITFGAVERSVTAFEPVYITLSINNGLAEEIRLDPALDNDSLFDLSVVEPNGITIRPARVVPGGLLRVGRVSIPAGKVFSRKFLLNERYQFKRSGEFKLRIWLSGSLQTATGKPVQSDPQDMTFIVSGRDEQRLRDVCESLAKVATGTSNYQKMRDATEALGYLADPIAVPYLARIIAKHNFVSEVAVEGLVRIGDSEALKVLTSHLDTPDPELKMKIEAAIEEIKTGVHPRIMD